MALVWSQKAFHALTLDELYAILQLRQQVFVVEQTCAFNDTDGLDPQCWHLFARDATSTLVAYARIVPAGQKYDVPSIGRVVTAPAIRGTGVGIDLMRRAVLATHHYCGHRPIRIGAQAHLQHFYHQFGFVTCSDVYDEDGIPHVEMQTAS